MVIKQEAKYDYIFRGSNAASQVHVMYLELKLQQVRSG